MTTNEPTKPEICGAIIHVGFAGSTWTCGEPKESCTSHNAEARAKALGDFESSQTTKATPTCCDKCKTYQGQVPICANAACSCHVMLAGNSEPSKEKVFDNSYAMCKCGHKLTWHIHKDIPESNCLNIDDPSCECLSFQKVESEWIGERRFMCHNQTCKGGGNYFYGYEKMRDCPWCGGKDVTWRPVEVHLAPPFATEIAAARDEGYRDCNLVAIGKIIEAGDKARAAAIADAISVCLGYLLAQKGQQDIETYESNRGFNEGVQAYLRNIAALKGRSPDPTSKKTLRDNPDGSCKCRPLGKSCFFTDGLGNRCDCKCHCPPEPTQGT